MWSAGSYEPGRRDGNTLTCCTCCKHYHLARRHFRSPSPSIKAPNSNGGCMADIKIFNPAELNKPRSPYMQVALVKTSQLAFIAGQVSVDASGALIGKDDFEAQCDRVFANIHAALRSVGADWKNV